MIKTLDPVRVLACLLALVFVAVLAAGGSPERAVAQGSSAPKLDAKAWAVADADSGQVLASKNADEQIKMASTAKVMTALVVLDSNVKMDDEVVISKGAEQYVGNKYSNVGLISGETVTVKDLLAASLIPSGTDADYALAQYVGGGSVAQFVQQMNQKADDLGLKNTHFTNPTGIDEKNNYSSASDLLKITSEAMKHDLFRKLVSQTHATINTKGVKDRKIDVYNTNELLTTYPPADGVKTGTSSSAGYMLISSAKAQNESYLAAVLGAKSQDALNQSSQQLLDYAFGTFDQQQLVKKGKVYAEKKLPSRSRSIKLTAADNISATVDQGAKVERRIRGGDLPSSAKKGQEVGQVEVIVGGRSVGTSALLASEGYDKPSLWQRTGGRVTSWIGGLFG